MINVEIVCFNLVRLLFLDLFATAPILIGSFIKGFYFVFNLKR